MIQIKVTIHYIKFSNGEIAQEKRCDKFKHHIHMTKIQMRPYCVFLIFKVIGKYSIKACDSLILPSIYFPLQYIHELYNKLVLHRISSFPTLEGANGGDSIPSFTRFQCNRTRPIYTTTHITDVATSCFPCCSNFLFELMYIHPVWSVSAFSCLRRCSIVLFLCVVGTSSMSSLAVF